LRFGFLYQSQVIDISHRKLAFRAALAMVARLSTSAREVELRRPNAGFQGRGERLTSSENWYRPALALFDAFVGVVENSSKLSALL
jgi:hypothetical protein